MVGLGSDAVAPVRRDAITPLRDDIAKLVFSLITKRVARFFLVFVQMESSSFRPSCLALALVLTSAPLFGLFVVPDTRLLRSVFVGG